MYTLECDYNEGAHPLIMEALCKTNMEQLPGYGADYISLRAKDRVKAACGCRNASVFFLAGGTQTNQLIISTMLKPYEGVIAATTGHVSTHEAGAIEYTGHKVLTIPEHTGLIDNDELEKYLADYFADGNHEHMVFPGMVYISFPSEYGTLYSKEQLQKIRKTCDKYNQKLFVDGARLGYGLVSDKADITLEELSKLADVFYIGGTKVGALIGEAIVFPRGDEPQHFLTMTKQHGALLAKGRLIGIQFDTLFTDDLYLEIAKNAIEKAKKLKEIMAKHGFDTWIDSPTNQQFFVMENSMLAKLNGKFGYSFWEKYDDTKTVIRLATSWATNDEILAKLDEVLSEIKGV